LKIDVFTSSVSRAAGGLFDAIKDLYMPIKDQVDVSVYSYEDEHTKADLASWKPLNMNVYKTRNPFLYSAEVKKALLASDANVLHVHGLWRYPHAFITAWKSKTKKPVVVTPHGMLDPYILANQFFLKRLAGKYLFAQKAFKNVDCYHALCIAELEAIRAYGITHPVAIIPNGINITGDNIRREPADGKKHLLFLARLHPKKGVDILLEALGKLKNSNPELIDNWMLDIVGWAQENFDQKLHAIVKKYSLEEYVTFHGGLFDKDKENMYATANAYILPSHGEGLPMTVLEAWSWGLPVIMTPQCNLPEGFEHNAAIKIEDNTESIYENLKTFFQMTEEEKNLMGSNGKKLVIAEFTWKLAGAKMVELYSWLVNKGVKPAFVHLTSTK